jgi:hypothetical protein
MTSRRHKNVGAIAVAGVITLVLGACAGDEAGASQGATKLANRTLTPPATGGAGTGPAETGPAKTAPPSAPGSTTPVVNARMCSDGARWRLKARGNEDRVKVRFEVHQSLVGHSWRIHFRHMEHNITTHYGPVFFRGTRVASDSGVLVAQLTRPNERQHSWHGVAGRAVDRQTGEVCEAEAWYR